MGSRSIREQIENEQCIRSILFYGPDGCGKTLMAEAVASELGAMIIDLSPSRLAGNFTDKNGATKLIHMVFSVAKDPLYAPVVIYVDECDQIFQTTKKKKGSSDTNGLRKFQKDLLIYKNQSLSKEDRVLIIGCTKHPELADFKTLKWKGARGKPEKQGKLLNPQRLFHTLFRRSKVTTRLFSVQVSSSGSSIFRTLIMWIVFQHGRL